MTQELRDYLDMLIIVDKIIDNLYREPYRGIYIDMREITDVYGLKVIPDEYNDKLNEIYFLVRERLSYEMLDNTTKNLIDSDYYVHVNLPPSTDKSLGISEQEKLYRRRGTTTRLVNQFIQDIFQNPNKSIRIYDHIIDQYGYGYSSSNRRADSDVLYRVRRRIEYEFISLKVIDNSEIVFTNHEVQYKPKKVVIKIDPMMI